jgi:hypothetical protein
LKARSTMPGEPQPDPEGRDRAEGCHHHYLRSYHEGFDRRSGRTSRLSILRFECLSVTHVRP